MSTCTSNFAGVVSTRVQNPPAEGMWIECKTNPSEIVIGVKIHPNSESYTGMSIRSGPDVWFYSTVVWRVGTKINIYEDGLNTANGTWSTEASNVEVNNERMIAFGIAYTDETVLFRGMGYVDGVRLFNRPLSSIEVQSLLWSYGTELKMETLDFGGNALLNSYDKVVS